MLFRSGVNVPTICTAGWGEVAPYERFEDAVAAEGYEAAVVRVRLVVCCVVEGEAVVEVRGVVLRPLYQSKPELATGRQEIV